MKKVSIITPSFNQGNYIEKTILSVLDQSYTSIEYIIIDGGSTDITIDIIKKYEKHIDYWVSEPDNGQADAINKGIIRATGELIAWVNSDDILYKDFIEKRVDEFNVNPGLDMIYGDVEQGPHFDIKVTRKGRQTSFNEMLLTGNIPIPQQSCVFTKDILEKVGFLNPNYNVLLDRDLFMRIAYFGKIKYTAGVTGFFLNHEDSKSILLEIEWIKEYEIYYKWLFDQFLDRSYKKFRNKAYSNMFGRCAVISFNNSRYLLFFRYIIMSTLRNPARGIKYMLKSLMQKRTHG